MYRKYRPMWALVLLCATTRLLPAIVVQSVIDYDPGTGFAVEFGTELGYTLTEAVLGEPNPDTGFDAVTPFNPPYERSELLSMGVGGHLVVELDASIWNNPDHPFGIDFIIYGSTGFLDVDYPNGITDEMASSFGQNLGETRLWVSADNVDFFMLDPALAPVVDGFFPTDGAGEFGLAVDPSLTQMDFAGVDLGEIRTLYNGSAGGTGYDLDWALDGSGQRFDPGQVRFLRVEVLSGRAELDAIMGVTSVPEPAVSALAGLGLLWVMLRRRFGKRNNG